MENPAEIPQEEVKEEVKQESIEAPQAAEQVDRATFDSEASVEHKGEYVEAEAVAEALTESLAIATTDEVSATPITLPSEDSEPRPQIEASAPAEEVSATPITLPSEDSEPRPQKEADRPVEAMLVTAATVSDRVEGIEDDSEESELVMVSLDGESDEPQIDWDDGLESADDLSKPTSVSDQYDPSGPSNEIRGEGVGYLGDVPGDGIEIPGGDPTSGLDPDSALGGRGSGTDIDSLVGQAGLEPWAEREDLKGSAAAGADPRISSEDDKDTSTSGDTGGDTSGDSTTGDLSFPNVATAPAPGTPVPIPYPNIGLSAGDSSISRDKKTTIGTSQGDNQGIQTGVASGRAMDFKQDGSRGSKKSGPQMRKGLVLGSQTTPNPDAADGEADDSIEGLLESALPDVSPDYLDAESLMQPAGEESDREKPRENLQAAMADGDVDPYALYTGEEVEIPPGAQGGEVDPDINPIDPPDMAGGGEDGFIDPDSNKKRESD